MVQYDTTDFEVDRAYCVPGGDEICLHNFGRPHERDYLANVGMDIRIILKWILRKYKNVYCIEFVHSIVSFILL